MKVADERAVALRLVEEFGYLERGAELLAKEIAALSGPVAAAFQQWWDTGILPSIEVEGYTAQRLTQQFGMNEIAALLALGWLQREPDKALRVLRKGREDARFAKSAGPRPPNARSAPRQGPKKHLA